MPGFVVHDLACLLHIVCQITTFRKTPDVKSLDNLLTNMFCCQSFCPFCKGLWDYIFGNRKKERFTLIHRPLCLSGHRYEEDTGKPDLAICPHKVSGNAKFRNAATSQEYTIRTKNIGRLMITIHRRIFLAIKHWKYLRIGSGLSLPSRKNWQTTLSQRN